MKILIFDTKGQGHHIEYIHHLYMYAGTEATQHTFIFALSPEFNFMYKERDFPSFPNIQVILMDATEVEPLQQASGLVAAYRQYRLLKKYVQRYRPNQVFLNALVSFMPFLALAPIGHKLVSGILYIIPRRKQGTLSLKKRLADRLRMWLYAKSPAFHRVFLLNDQESAQAYNTLFGCSTFRFLPDPFVPIASHEAREGYPVFPSGKKVFLHFGGMGERKGTFCILDAMARLSREAKANSVFVFAGVVSNPGMHRRFMEHISSLEKEMDTYFLEGFIPFEELGYLCHQADYLLVPYKNVEQSSGVIGYAAQFNKPVIGPDKGLLGHLITHYGLGHALPDVSGPALAAFLEKVIMQPDKNPAIDGSRYLQVCEHRHFAQIIINE